MTRPYRFGIDKVHPAPTLDPAVAPWSAPRGYTTSILEEAYAMKAANRAANRSAVVAATTKPLIVKQRKRRKAPACFSAVADHFRSVFRELAANLRFNKTKLVAKLCCLHAEISA